MNNINILLHARIPKLLCKHKDDNKAKKKNQADRKTFLQVFGDDIKLERQALVKI